MLESQRSWEAWVERDDTCKALYEARHGKLCFGLWLGKPQGWGGGAGRVPSLSPVLPPTPNPRRSYVKSYLFPDKQSKRKTAVKKRNLNPVFNETLRVRLQGPARHS